ncbi:MAG: hypothetical protein H7A35_01150 [Planctomycetales bacterium]|nr:hypothetical protein [bacterium]UNM08666.1 MAG: hypothetical protein H7A35_01150 [Planctomycetales bacterium]
MCTASFQSSELRFLAGIFCFVCFLAAAPSTASATEATDIEQQFRELDLSDWFEWNALHGHAGPRSPNTYGPGSGNTPNSSASREELLVDSVLTIKWYTDNWPNLLVKEAGYYYAVHHCLPRNGLKLVLGIEPEPDEMLDALEQLRNLEPGDPAIPALLAFNPATGKYIDSFDNPDWNSLAINLEMHHDFPGLGIRMQPDMDNDVCIWHTLAPWDRLWVRIYGKSNGSVLKETFTGTGIPEAKAGVWSGELAISPFFPNSNL